MLPDMLASCIIAMLTIGNLAFATEHTSFAPPFANTYFGIEGARNSPMSYTQNNFNSGYLHPIISYRHNLKNGWITGVSSQFKILRKKNPSADEPSEVAIWTFSHEPLYAIRLNHPVYFLLGPLGMYMLPTKSASLPLKKDTNFESEIGAGLTCALFYLTSNKNILSFRLSRWRGTKTTRFHGIESSFGFSYAIK